MNEELKIIISAVTTGVQKGVKDAQNQLKGLKDGSGKAFGAMKKAAGVAAGAVVAVGTAIVASAAALVNASKSTEEYRKSMAQLTTAFQANGGSAEQAKKTYGELFRFMGETDTAVEASNLLSQLTTDEKELAQWTKTLQGVYATFPDSLPIEALAESANETAKVGKVTGNLADALNWAGESEEAFNAKLAALNTSAEREALIRNTLSGLYSDAAELYEENAKAILAQNEAQHRLNETLAQVGAAAQPLQTAVTNLSASLLEALAPAINAIVPYLVTFINWISSAVGWVMKFIGALTGSNKASKEIAAVATNAKKAAGGAGAIAKGINGATAAAEKLKRTTQGFDELNVVASETASSAGGSSTGGGTGAGGGVIDTAVDTGGLTSSLDKTSASVEKFAAKVKSIFNDLKTKVKEWAQLFSPSVTAWKDAFTSLGTPIKDAFTSIKGSFETLKTDTLIPIGDYLVNNFIPDLTNNFSENFAPIFKDIAGASMKQMATDFEWAVNKMGEITNDILLPLLDSIKTITKDTANAIGDEWKVSGETLLTKFSGVIESLKGIWDNFYNSTLKPVWEIIKKAIDDIWKEHLEPLWRQILSFASKLGECIMTIWNNFLAPIVNWLITVLAPVVINVVNTIMGVVKTIIGVISGVVKGILKSLGGVLDFITGVFSGNWKKAWQGIKDSFAGIFDAIWAVAKGIINLIIDAINGLWSGIYSVISGLVNGIGSIAGAIGNLLGKDWNFKMPKKAPTIPKLATGGIVNSATIAMIGERGKEAVLPLENNTGWIDMLADKLAARNGGNKPIYLMVDKKVLGEVSADGINDITRLSGSFPLVLA